MNKRGTLKQILLITDGCSNEGEDPQEIALLAREHGVTVNVIGILDDYARSDDGLEEVEGIAEAGGGVSQIVQSEQLSQTVQMVTRQAMTQTLQGVINKELTSILGKEHALEELPPAQRGEIVEVVEELGETSELQIVVLVDVSASMKSKLQMVKEALLDLSVSLSARSGNNSFCLKVFPGKKQAADELMPWTPDLTSVANVFPKLTSGGITPTGPALKLALNAFPVTQKRKRRREEVADDYDYREKAE
ncbi:VWA domain-containing protein [Aureibacillus halotolerans]|uniref:Ca-activated chloride channel family protein n=1 Tax=Aureibacillus halotolerans TaxID=1508390 RepID=A0A4R6TXI2_9BACI|nr:VWA domain-containing protein [Aureibacillus halotolerans]TDQ34215.1 Ca-activated chloride channel family protein [Aureibacillus halotolerans]